MAGQNADVVVVGMGPGGEAAASQLASAGLDVVAVESRLVGGECPYFACVPTKMMVRAAGSLAEARRVPRLAGTAQIEPDLSVVARRIRQEATTDWDDQIAVDRYLRTGGRFVRGRAEITGPGAVQVGDQEFHARRAVILNTGTDPAVPAVPGLASTPYWTNRQAVAAEQAPESLVVLGGGPVGAEFAQIFARFGTRVDLVHTHDRLLVRDEPEASSLLAKALEADGVHLHLGASVQQIGHDGEFSITGPGLQLRAQRLLVATGRRTDYVSLGLGTVGVATDGRFLPTDAHCRAADGLYAIGDITGHGAYTHMSMYQAGIVVADILGDGAGPAADYRAVPHVTFTDPEIGAVGLTEQRAREQGVEVVVGTSDVAASTRGWIHGGTGVIKLVADAATGVLVGATSAGPSGGEVLSMLTLAVQERIPVARLQQMIYAYPTFHRAVQTAADQVAQRLPAT